MSGSEDTPSSPFKAVAFLFTDIQGSTRLWQAHPHAMPAAYRRHDDILRRAVADARGAVYKVVGDGVQAAFPTAEQAVAAALAAQRGLMAEDWAAVGLPEPLRVRAALHAGAVEPDADGDYRSPVLNRLGRLLAAAHGGQTLLSHEAAELARDRLPAGAGLRDLGEHRLRDLPEPARIHQLTHPDLPADFPEPRTLERRRHNLPVQPTPLIGRERQVEEVAELVRREDVRLVTLTGPGGMGKTRLALHVAAQVVDELQDGAWLVPLAAVTDPAGVAVAVAEALGVRDAGGAPLLDQIDDTLRGRCLLLVLDNFEQVLDAAPVVQRLLASPGVTVLVTSRAPLHLRAERAYAVPPLSLPATTERPTAEALAGSAAVRLFAARAEAARADFRVTDADAPAVAEICRRLDGLPLAIELAAARTKLLAPRALLARLDQRLPLLIGGARDLPERQQTLRAAIAWSYDLLSEDERRLHRRLSVFAGRWTIEAAEAVAGAGPDVLELLGRLVDHSLVRPSEGPDGEPRFAMLETIREFGAERLEAAGEADDLRRRHAAHLLALVETVRPLFEPGVDAAAQRAALDRLEAEQADLRRALTWALDADPGVGLRLCAAGWKFWAIRGHFEEGRSFAERALAHPGGDPRDRATVLAAVTALAQMQGDLTAAERRGEAALALFEELGDEGNVAFALMLLANVLGDAGRGERARQLYERALAIYRRLGDRSKVGMVLDNLGVELIFQGAYADARLVLEEALAISRETGDAGLESRVHGNLAEMAEATGNPATALAHERAALVLSWGLGDTYIVVLSLHGIGLAVRHEQPARAARLLGAAERGRETMGMTLPVTTVAMNDRAVAEVRAALGEGAFAAAWAAGRALSLAEAVAEASGAPIPGTPPRDGHGAPPSPAGR